MSIVGCDDREMENDLCPMDIEVVLVSEQRALSYKQYDCRHLGKCEHARIREHNNQHMRNNTTCLGRGLGISL